MIQAYRLNTIEKHNYMYSKAQFIDALNASGLIGKKVAHFYTEFASTDDSVQTSSKGYALVCNNTLIIETEDGDWYEFYVAGEGAIAFSKNEYIKTGIYTITGKENDDWVVAEIAYSPFVCYRNKKVIDIKIIDDKNLAYAPKGFDAPDDAILPQSITFEFEDGAKLTVLGEHDFIGVEFDTSVPRGKFSNARLTFLQEKLKVETDESKIKELNACIQIVSNVNSAGWDQEYYQSGLQAHMAKYWDVDLYTNPKGYSFLVLKYMKSFRVSDPVNIAKNLLTLGLKFIEFNAGKKHQRKFQSFSFTSEDESVLGKHKLFYYFDLGLWDVCVTLDQKKRLSEKLFMEDKQNRWIAPSFIEDIWCIGTRYNLDAKSLDKLQDYLTQWEIESEESAKRVNERYKKETEE